MILYFLDLQQSSKMLLFAIRLIFLNSVFIFCKNFCRNVSPDLFSNLVKMICSVCGTSYIEFCFQSFLYFLLSALLFLLAFSEGISETISELSLCRTQNIMNGAKNISLMKNRASSKPPQSPSQSSMLYVYLFIIARSLFKFISTLAYL